MPLKRIPQPGKFVLHELELLKKQAENQYPTKVAADQMSETTANVRYSRICDAVDFFRALLGTDPDVGDNDEVEDPDQPLPLYTDLDRLHYMVEKNPKLKELVTRLGLEL